MELKYTGNKGEVTDSDSPLAETDKNKQIINAILQEILPTVDNWQKSGAISEADKDNALQELHQVLYDYQSKVIAQGTFSEGVKKDLTNDITKIFRQTLDAKNPNQKKKKNKRKKKK